MNQPEHPVKPQAEKPKPEERAGTGFFLVIKSVLAAGFGVQSRENRERDFEKGKPIHFIIGGIVGTLCFVLIIAFAVKALLASAT